MGCCMHGVTRRQLLAGASALPLLPGVNGAAPKPGERVTLRVQPVLVYQLPQRRTQTSWRNWGGLQTAQDVIEEKERIGREVRAITQQAVYPVEMLPLREVTDVAPGKAAAAGDYDVLLSYAAGGGANVLESVSRPDSHEITRSPRPVQG